MSNKMLSDEWGTPLSVFELIHRFFPRHRNSIMLDPFPSPVLENNGSMFFKSEFGSTTLTTSIGKDGISGSFVNPPFSNIELGFRAINPWGLDHNDWGIYKRGIMVVPDHTDAWWWQKYVIPSMCNVLFIGRHKFIPLAGQKESSPTFGTALLDFGCEADLTAYRRWALERGAQRREKLLRRQQKQSQQTPPQEEQKLPDPSSVAHSEPSDQ